MRDLHFGNLSRNFKLNNENGTYVPRSRKSKDLERKCRILQAKVTWQGKLLKGEEAHESLVDFINSICDCMADFDSAASKKLRLTVLTASNC